MIVVIGAGPVGIYVTNALLAKGYKVHLIEAGEEEKETPLLSRDSYIFRSKSAMPPNVHRIGGGSNLWHARFGQFLETDFEAIPELGVEGWPIGANDLQKHYLKVMHEISGDSLTDEEYINENYVSQKRLANLQGLELRCFRFADSFSFHQKFKELKHASNLIVSTSSRVDEIVTRQSGSNHELICTVTNERSKYQIKADKIVLTAGTLQSTFLFLNSKDLICNSHTHIAGEGLMEHMEGFIGVMKVPNSNRDRLNLFLLSHNNRITGRNSGVGIRHRTETIKKFNLTSFHVELRPLTRTICQPKEILSGLFPNPLYYFERVIKYVLFRLNELIDFLQNQSTCGLWAKAEELRNTESTLKICHSMEARKILYNHEISASTFEKFFSNVDLMLPRLTELFGSKVKLKRWVRKRTRNLDFGVNWHPMGTLPMGKDPNRSVCDTNLALHANNNIFLVSGAVFNRGSNGNPTFTALALASRMIEEVF